MSMMSTGISALNTAQIQLATTYHNIANAETPGYSRQAGLQATNFGIMTGVGAIGQGVHINTVMRSYSDILTKQLQDAQTRSSELDVYYSMISRIDNLLADSTSGLSPVLAGFFQAVQDVAANPSMTSARQSMVSAAEALASRFQTLDNRLFQLYDETNNQIENAIAEINAYSSQIAEVNRQIVAYNGTNHMPNDLLDQRDQLVLELNQLVGVNTYLDDNFALNVFTGAGQALVVGTQTILLETRRSSSDPERLVVAQKGSWVELPENYLSGGIVGGLMAFRREALDQAANVLGQVAASIALTVNAQQELGQDLLGEVLGGSAFVSEFFKISLPKSIENSNNHGTGSIASFTFNPPTLSENDNFFTQLTGSDYELRFLPGGPPTPFEITRLSDKQVVASGTDGDTVQFDGLTLELNTGHLPGDTYRLEPTREIARNIKVNQEIAGDVRRIAAAMPIRTGASPDNTGTAQISAGEVVDSSYVIPSPPWEITFNGVTGELEINGTPGSVLVNGNPTPFPMTYNSGDEFIIDGFRFTLTGIPQDGDVFIIEANTGGVADSRNMVKIGALQTALTMNGDSRNGLATFQVGYAQLVSKVGTQTKTVLSNGKAQDLVLNQAFEKRSQLAGVNLDEEATNLMKYQQAYQAAARMLNTVSVLFDTLLSIRS
ncbi:MAG: flagellar hook-associated protein FlgK [Zoogloeaceae bacterium]|jgi:flagellar hook-associated protein 1 FlgK|nr:flagellar hook-associated protein FlgK [Zoogloeaceae bacterium]